MQAKSFPEQKRRSVGVKRTRGDYFVASRDVSHVLYKSLLSNPSQVTWPHVSANLQNFLLARVIELIKSSGIAEFRSKRRSIRRVRLKHDPEFVDNSVRQVESEPVLLNHLVFGINVVTKRLEAQRNITKSPDSAPLSVIFVCRGDINPPALVEHLPQLVASCNASDASNVHLVPFSSGSEDVLSNALGVRRACIVAFDQDTPGLGDLLACLKDLSTPVFGTQFCKSHMKQLKISLSNRDE